MSPEIVAQNNFDSTLVVYNPASERSRARLEHILPQLEDPALYMGKISVGQSSQSIKANISMLNSQVRGENNLIIAAGGDGLTNDIANALMHASTEIESKSTLIPDRSGHANDFSNSIFNRADQNNISNIVNYGTKVDVFPLSSTIATPGNTQIIKRIALAYLSFGSTGEISHIVNLPKYRDIRYSKTRLGQRIDDIRLGMHIMSKRQEYQITIDGKTEVVTDYGLYNGSSVAGMLPIKGNIITKKEAVRSIIKPGDVYYQIIKAAFGMTYRVDSNFNQKMIVNSKHPIHIQLDGNTYEIVDGSSIELGISKTPIQTLTTRKINLVS